MNTFKKLSASMVALLVTASSFGAPTLLNGSFEEVNEEGKPVGWDVVNWIEDNGPTVATQVAREGTHSIRFAGRKQSKGFQAVNQKISVTGGEKYSFGVFVRSDDAAPFRGPDAYGQLVVQWIDADGREVGRIWTPGWKHTLTRLRWEFFSIRKVRAPDQATEAIVGIHLYEGKSGAEGAFFADDVTVSSP